MCGANAQCAAIYTQRIRIQLVALRPFGLKYRLSDTVGLASRRERNSLRILRATLSARKVVAWAGPNRSTLVVTTETRYIPQRYCGNKNCVT